MFSSGLFAQGIEPNSLQPTPYQGGILKGVTPYVDPFSGDTYYIYQHDTLVLNPDSIYVKTATAPDPDTIYLRDGSGFALIPKGGGGGSGTVTSVGLETGTTGTDVNVTGSPITTSGTFTLNIPTASATNTGKLSSSDWTTFNNKVGGTGTATRIPYWQNSNTLIDGDWLKTQAGNYRLLLGSINRSMNIGVNSGNNNQGNDNINIGLFNGNGFGAGNADNISIGNQNYWSSTSGTQNITLGRGNYIYGTGSFNINIGSGINQRGTGSNNVYIGRSIAGNSVAGAHFENVGIGYNIMNSITSAYRNVANGSYALATLTSGNENLGLGFYGAAGITSGSSNIGIGAYSLAFGTGSRIRNIGIGGYALANATGDEGVGIGYNAGRYQGAGSVCVGTSSFANTTATGSYNVGLGYLAGFFETGSNRLYIENSNSLTPLIGGHFDNDRVGINTEINSIARTLHVTGEARITDLVTDTPTRILGADADGDLGELKVGNGLTISNDSLIVTVSGGGDDWGSQVVESDITLLGDGTAGNVLKVDTSIIATQYDLTQININDADADPNNEIQNLSHTVSGTNRTINISGGTGTTISVADNDNSSTNELNTSLTVSHIAGNALPRVRITDAGGTLEGLVPFFSTSNVNAGVVPGSNGASNSNFLRADGIWATPVSSGMTNWNLGINNGSYTAVGDGANVSLNAGTNVTLSKSGNTVTINSPSRQTWADFGSNMQAWFSTGAYGSGKDVGIGVSPTADLDVNGTTRLRGPIFNSANSSGTSGQVLTSQGSGAWTWTTISSTDDQNLSYGTKSGNRIPLDIQDGVGVNFDEGRGILLTRTSSNVLTVNGRRDWMHVSSSSFNQTLTANTWAVLNLSDSPSGYNFTWNNTTKRLTKTGFDGNVYLNFNCLARIGSTNTGTLEVGYFLNGSGTPFRVRNYTLANMSEDFEINLQENQYMGVNDYIEIKVRASADRTVNFDTPSFNAQPQDH